MILVEPGAIRSAFRETLRRAWGDLPARAAGTKYAAAIEAYASKREDFAAAHGLPAEVCAARIGRAMARRRPPRRVIVGADSLWGQVAHRLLPARLFAWILRRSYGLA